MINQKLVAYVLVVLSYIGGWILYEYNHARFDPAVPAQTVTIDIAKGDSFQTVTDKLIAQKVRLDAFWFHLIAWQDGASKKIKSGEYELAPHLTAPDILQTLVRGKTVQHALTLVEGWNIRDVCKILVNDPHLDHVLKCTTAHEIAAQLGMSENHAEGLFFPDTYFFEKHATDLSLLKRAYDKMRLVLAQEWQTRADNLPLSSPYQALILASIVEKETADVQERAQIAGVFTRRLQQNMRLQTDPTVIYGMGESYQGDIKSADLRKPTPYNTYVQAGLPPTPIALPSQAAIHATLHPDHSDNLYFVARGDGTHVFSATLEAHNLAVETYQKKRSPQPASQPVDVLDSSTSEQPAQLPEPVNPTQTPPPVQETTP